MTDIKVSKKLFVLPEKELFFEQVIIFIAFTIIVLLKLGLEIELIILQTAGIQRSGQEIQYHK